MQNDINAIFEEVQKVIVGKENVIKKVFMSILANGHILLDDVPGVGKTTLAVALSKVLGMQYNRIQFTPDVLPSDIIGFSMFNKQTGKFEYRPGIVANTNLLLGDEINRTSSKTQSALLEAMEEGQVTVDGNTYPLNKPFIVIATQNNVGAVGTQLLPYAQLDRFLVRLSLGYPDFKSQVNIIKDRQTVDPINNIKQITDIEDILKMQSDVLNVVIKEPLIEYITQLSINSRENQHVQYGISPRGAISISRMAKARAYVEGRNFVIPEDIADIFTDVCEHRLVLNQKAKINDITAEQVLKDVLNSVRVPRNIK